MTISSCPSRSSAHNHRDRSCYNIVSSSSIFSSQPQVPIMLQYRLVQLDLQLTTTGTDHVTISSCPPRSSVHNHRDRSCYNIVSSSSIFSSQPQVPIMLQYRLVQLDLQFTTTGTDHVTISSCPPRSSAHNHRDRSCDNIVLSTSIFSSQPQVPIMLQYRLVQLDLQLTTTGTDHVTISSCPSRSSAHNHRDRSCDNIVLSTSIFSSQPQGPIM